MPTKKPQKRRSRRKVNEILGYGLNTPNAGNANNVRNVNSDGSLNNNNARNGNNGVRPDLVENVTE